MTFKEKMSAFFDGWASAYDLFGSRVERPDISNPAQKDAEALASDWVAVGNDLRSAFGMVALNEK